MDKSLSFPQFPESYWRATANSPEFPALQEDITTDVAIVGGGISGITTAYLLTEAGLKVTLLEAGKLMNGTTGHTTAKITAQHDLIYDELISKNGEEKAKLYYQANHEALAFISSIVHQNGLDCGFSEQDAYIYTNDETYIDKLERELAAYEKLGIPRDYVASIPLNIPARAAIVMKNQGQFHPLHYLNHLINRIVQGGGQIFEHTTAIDIDHGSRQVIITREGHRVTSSHVAVCTHFPFYDGISMYFARLHAERSYVLGVKAAQPYPGGMYLSAEDPKRSIRSTKLPEGSELLIIGGQNHKSGQGICTFEHYEALQSFTAATFGEAEIAYRWSAQDLTTIDNIPYTGQIRSSTPHIFVATGYRKWGMTNGTASAILLRDLILDKDSPYAELYNPSRGISAAGWKELIVENVDVAKHLIAGKLEMIHKRAEDLAPDEGCVVTHHGKRAGAYKDKQGQLHLVDTTCTHMGCEVEWNNGDRTWDCPCHGSRFAVSGEVVEGPAERPLKKLKL
ncbi:FAD-dependent oxidoreductase [Paenibacillus sp. GCM10023252]|uniref:FAD-dependent oxidoreductase n=1 Tax=Paenibacillus sp. GCM10023252 TaxID=3252649 RepID=UPI00361B9BCE